MEQERCTDTSPSGTEPFTHPQEEYTFYLPITILESMFTGMKFTATIRRLDMGFPDEPSKHLWYIDSVSNVYCSFYTCLLNGLVPKKVPGVKWLGSDRQVRDVEEGERKAMMEGL